MCGICFICKPRSATKHPSHCQDQDAWLEDDLLLHRGPNACRKHEIALPCKLQGLMQGCVLHLRGDLTPQPLISPKGNILLWNGEVFGGLKVKEGENDTQILFNTLEDCLDQGSVLETLQSIQGPWAFVYWQAATKTLWFGRDMFGRRSLLWHLPEDCYDNFVLTSVALGKMVYKELPSVGIFAMDFAQIMRNEMDPNLRGCGRLPSVVVYPWKDCRWPGTSQRVLDTKQKDLMSYLYPDTENVDASFSVQIDQECRLKTWIPTMVSGSELKPYGDTLDDQFAELSTKVVPDASCSLGAEGDGDGSGLDGDLENLLCHIYEERIDLNPLIDSCIETLMSAVEKRVENIPQFKDVSIDASESIKERKAKVAVLFSGGLDSTLLAALVDRCLPPDEPIDLLNVAFEQDPPASPKQPCLKQKRERQNKRKAQSKTSGSSCTEITPCSSLLTEDTRNKQLLNREIVEDKNQTVFHEQNSSSLNSQSLHQINPAVCDASSSAVSCPETQLADNGKNFESAGPCNRLDTSDVLDQASGSHKVNDEQTLCDLKSAKLCDKQKLISNSCNLKSSNHNADDSTRVGEPAAAFDPFNVPDRQTGRTAFSELNPDRKWNFVDINVTKSELKEVRQSRISRLIYPLRTVLDDSIGCAVWFAARGMGMIRSECQQESGVPYHSRAQVLICGMAADELFAGYSRHRVTHKSSGLCGLHQEIEKEMWRISARNLGRDDRIIGDHGKEARFPYLDEKFVDLISRIPLRKRVDFQYPRGIGEKLLLRLCALKLGLVKTACQAKRAIQFGSKIAKLDKKKEKGSDVCDRLL